MDPSTALLIASFMGLLNGGVLGLMHRNLLPEVQDSAVAWRTGTLLFAGAGMVLAVGDERFSTALPATVYLMVLAGAILCWRSIRLFSDVGDNLWPSIMAAVIGVAVLAGLVMADVARGGWMVAISAILIVIGIVTVRTLQRSRRSDVVVSRRVLTLLLYFVVGAMSLRNAYFFAAMADTQLAVHLESVDAVATAVILALPVIGTTAVLLMCLERARHELQQMADTDDLTGLPNRRSIVRDGERRFSSVHGSRGRFGVAVIDVDHFKSINDRFGHEYGDAALRHIATVLHDHCGPPHLLGRQGGEEFVAILDVEDADGAMTVSQRMREAVVAARFVTAECTLPVSVSIGVSVAVAADTCYDDILRRADTALYEAKAQGRNRVEYGHV